MFRLSQIKDLRLQEIISKEILNAFEDTFKISSNNRDEIISNIEMFCDDMEIPLKSKLDHDLTIYKIMGMIQEVADTKYAYTFDEHGDWIFSKFLLYHLNKYEFFLSLTEDDDSSIEDYWESSLTTDDIAYVKEFADNHFAGLAEDISEDEEDAAEIEEEFAEQKALFIDRVTYFPLMAFELTDDVIPEFLFWDRDFYLIDQYGPESFDKLRSELERVGDPMGLMKANENTQFYTGSEKFDLNEQ